MQIHFLKMAISPFLWAERKIKDLHSAEIKDKLQMYTYTFCTPTKGAFYDSVMHLRQIHRETIKP